MLPKPFKSAVIYEDKKLYACLANFPIAEGHTVVVWKKKVTDLHLLSKKDYLYLMDIVDKIRTAMLKTLKVKKYTLFIWTKRIRCIGILCRDTVKRAMGFLEIGPKN